MSLNDDMYAPCSSTDSVNAHSSELCQIENWLGVLTKTYATHPSDGLAKVIIYYLMRFINHNDFTAFASQPCHYFSMLKFWREQVA